MKIIFTSEGQNWNDKIDPRLGRAACLLLYNTEKDTLEATDNADSAKESHGAGPQTVRKILALNPDIIITGNGPGGNAHALLSKTHIEIYVDAHGMSIKEAYEAFQNNKLRKLQ